MRNLFLITGVLAALIGSAGAKNADRTDQELPQQARTLLGTLVKVPDTCVVKVEPIPSGYGKGRRVIFQMEIPDTRWIMSRYPEVWFPDTADRPQLRVWDATQADEQSPGPEAIIQWFLHEKKDPEQCLRLLRVWFDANRNKGRVVCFAYDQYASAYRAAGRHKDWLPTLDRELAEARAPEAIYEIRKHMAQACLEQGDADAAIRHWQAAQEAMQSQSNSYIATRYALPFLELARIYIQQQKTVQAAEQFERYLATTHGKENPFEAIKSLGDIYEARHEFSKARALYMTVLAESFGKNWASASVLRGYQAPIRERVRLLDLREKLAALIGKLADPDGQVRMKAYREIEALGKDALPFLQPYRQDENLDIRGAVLQLIEQRP